ncbi:flagellar basal body rod C-terminal domain-containing protein [Hyphomicrobium sp.]|uniref:flagellar basal body rod C-terminal domain-containing protein n=1 Tax=Hyphomicrobium sp. TaxID=82 RepID=UPI002E310EB7|nr:flagellar basal body rod C-terminal domain-containing protein [Hyphomicrobium sp.]HEX2843215.1 flagellar basal body rod C-terminal domain-containing protein [Hyphomicrobium sp.]
MFPALTIASNALQVQSRRAEEIAASVASMGATQTVGNGRNTASAGGISPVRVGALPIGDEVETMVSLKEVELAYRMNAAVIATASEMLDSLLDVINPEKR